jgi:solute carrier family 25 phosphate transporter 23/24/25/41
MRAISKEGPLAFWKGNGANVVKIMPESAAKFYANDVLKAIIARDSQDIRVYERLAAGNLRFTSPTANITLVVITITANTATIPQVLWRGSPLKQ